MQFEGQKENDVKSFFSKIFSLQKIFIIFVVIVGIGYISFVIRLQRTLHVSDALTWRNTTIDSLLDGGTDATIAIRGDGVPVIVYWDGGSDDLMAAEYIGGSSGNCTDTSWNCYAVDSTGIVGAFVSIAVNNSGNPVVAYHNATDQSLRYAQYVETGGNCTSAKWNCFTIQDTANNIGYTTSIAINSSGNPIITYFDNTTVRVRYAVYVGGGGNCGVGGAANLWNCEEIADGNSTSIALNSSNQPIILFYNATTDFFNVAQYVGGGGDCAYSANWNCSTVFLDPDNTYASNILQGADGVPVIVLVDNNASRRLTYIRYVGDGTGSCSNTNWTCEEVESGVGTRAHIARNPEGDFFITYRSDANVLKLATYVGSGGTGCSSSTRWSCETVNSSTSGTSGRIKLAVKNTGDVYISYVDDDLDVLKYAYGFIPAGRRGRTDFNTLVAPSIVDSYVNEENNAVIHWKHNTKLDITYRIQILRDHNPVAGSISGSPYEGLLYTATEYVDDRVILGETYKYIVRILDENQNFVDSQIVEIKIIPETPEQPISETTQEVAEGESLITDNSSETIGEEEISEQVQEEIEPLEWVSPYFRYESRDSVATVEGYKKSTISTLTRKLMPEQYAVIDVLQWFFTAQPSGQMKQSLGKAYVMIVKGDIESGLSLGEILAHEGGAQNTGEVSETTYILTMKYSTKEMFFKGIKAEDLALFWYNQTTQTWEVVSKAVLVEGGAYFVAKIDDIGVYQVGSVR